MIKWILKHLRLLIVVVTVSVTAIIVTAVMVSSYVSYKNYEKTYYANDLEVRSATAAAPKGVEINDHFKSKYKTVNFIEENGQPNPSGNYEVTLELKEKSFADIVVVFNSEATDNLLGLMNIKVNNSLVEEDGVKVEDENDHNLVMSNFALPQGELKFEIAPINNKAFPAVQKISFYTSADANIIVE